VRREDVGKMKIDEFASITRRVIANDCFDDFLPTACYPKRSQIRALTELPIDIEPETEVMEWAAQHANKGEEYLVAFKSGPLEFTVIRQKGNKRESKKFSI
jgi:hypothetical protein